MRTVILATKGASRTKRRIASDVTYCMRVDVGHVRTRMSSQERRIVGEREDRLG